MIIDFTLNSLKFPGLENYTPPFGTKCADNVGLSTEDGCNNWVIPLAAQRPVSVAENSATSGNIERHSAVNMTTSGTTLTLTDGAFLGVKVEVYCTAASGSVSVICGAFTYTVAAGSKLTLTWDGSIWQNSSNDRNCLTYEFARWLKFDFTDANRQSVVIRKNTHIPLEVNGARRWLHIDADTSFDLSSAISAAATAAATRPGEANGRDFYIYLVPDGTGVKLTVSTLDTAPSDIDASYTTSNTKKIGQFHTLCANAGSLVATVPAANGTVLVGDNYLVKNYDQETDPDFYDFYNKSVSAVASNAIYDTLTVAHPLSGFTAGQILPESVWCLSFKPHCNPDGMMYDKDDDMAIDIYLQSGTGRNTRSAYGANTTRTRQQENHQADMNAVGKLLISDEEFTSAALGSNEKTNIAGSVESSVTTAGGHVDTASRRMISIIGCEDMCGAIWQWLRNVSANGGSNYTTYDGVGNFGLTYGASNALNAGGHWSSGASCGSRCRNATSARSVAGAGSGARGVSRVIRGQ